MNCNKSAARLSGLLAAGLLCACHSVTPEVDSPVANGPPGPDLPMAISPGAPTGAAPPAVAATDIATAAAIRRSIQQDPALADANVKVKVKKGVVTLRGRVPSELERQAILQRIDKLPGVDRVVDQLVVQQ